MNESTYWHEQLIKVAQAEFISNTMLEPLKRQRDGLYQGSGLAQLDATIATIEGRAALLKQGLKQEALDYVAETGSTDLHNLIEIRRTPKPQYNDAEALAWCEEHAPEFVVVKKSLDKRKFNSAVKDGIEFPGAEMVNDLTVAIRAVAHLLERSEGE